MRREAFELAGVKIAPGSRERIDMPVAQLYTHTPLHIPVEVLHGRRAGPVLLVCAAIHGDEINGVSVIQRLLKHKVLNRLAGTLIAVPIVNVFGFVQQTRYLPDRRDLNRCFPGSEKGSLGGRIAHLFKSEVMDKATHVVDLHTGAIHRSNLPQIRACLDNEETEKIARAFGAPVIIDAALRDGSLRGEAEDENKPFLTYEAGEALRFDEFSIRAGVRGVLSVMRSLAMLSSKKSRRTRDSEIVKRTFWVRANADGILHSRVELGSRIKKNGIMATISDPFGGLEEQVKSPYPGLVIGKVNIPLVNEGEALFNIARYDELDEAHENVEAFKADILPPADNGLIEDSE